MKRNVRGLRPAVVASVVLAGCGDVPAAPPDGPPSPDGESRVTVISTSPVSGAIGIARAATVSAAFSVAVDSASVHEGSFSLWRESTPVPATVTLSGGWATLTPKSLLDLGTTYTAVLSSDIVSPTGARLAGRYSWGFTTKLKAVP